MEENLKMFESLLDRATEYSKKSYELVRLKIIDKTSDVVSSLAAQSFVLVLLASFVFFINFGLALWLGEVIGKVYFGFFAVAALYALIALVLGVFFNNWLKKAVYNLIVKLMLK